MDSLLRREWVKEDELAADLKVHPRILRKALRWFEQVSQLASLLLAGTSDTLITPRLLGLAHKLPIQSLGKLWVFTSRKMCCAEVKQVKIIVSCLQEQLVAREHRKEARKRKKPGEASGALPAQSAGGSAASAAMQEDVVVENADELPPQVQHRSLDSPLAHLAFAHLA